MQTTIRELTQIRALPDGTAGSLASLGYSAAGIDDGWQRCGSYGPHGYRYHDEDGAPVVSTRKFPSLSNLTKFGKSLGVQLGWYGNACGCVGGQCCSDHCDSVECFAGDVNATIAYGFTSYKVDGCGAQRDVALWYEMFNHSLSQGGGAGGSAAPMLLENCHDGEGKGTGYAPYYDRRGELWCPFHTYRISSDARPTFGSILSNLNASLALLDANLSVPGCWAYLDMLEVGVTNTQFPSPGKHMNCGPDGEQHCPPLSVVEAQTHFGAWAILSSPLTLGFDLSDAEQMARHLPTIANRDALGVNQDYAGFSGSRFAQSDDDLVEFEACGWGASYPNRTNASCAWPRTVSLYKPLSGRDVRRSTVAVLLMNNGPHAAHSLGFAWSAVPSLAAMHSVESAGCVVYDVWRRKSLGRVRGPRFASDAVPAHASVFLTLSECGPRGSASY